MQQIARATFDPRETPLIADSECYKKKTSFVALW